MSRLEALSPRTIAETLAYLARRPYDNVFVGWLVESGQSSRGHTVLWRDDSGAIAGVCSYGAQIVPFADGNEAIDAFAERSRNARDARMIVGPRWIVERFWRGARGWFPEPSAIRTSQPVYALDRAKLAACADDPNGSAGRAEPNELDELAPQSAQMMAGELGGAPRANSPEFRDRCARIIAAGWWWRYRVSGELAFTCQIGSATPYTAQIQGVWAPPEHRGKGHATRGLSAVCDDMLATFPSLCLFVNDFNTRAIALYERVGFTPVGEFQSILFM